MKKILMALVVVMVAGCASNSGQDYYVAMAAAARANADTQQARFQALSEMAKSGDAASKTAAVMAIALTKNDVVAPAYIESAALKWAQVLAPTATALSLGVIQSGVAKNQSNNNRKVTMSAQEANMTVELGNQDLVGNISTGINTRQESALEAVVSIADTSVSTVGGIATDLIATQPDVLVDVVVEAPNVVIENEIIVP